MGYLSLDLFLMQDEDGCYGLVSKNDRSVFVRMAQVLYFYSVPFGSLLVSQGLRSGCISWYADARRN